MSQAIVVEDVNKMYDDKHAVCGVSLTVQQGEIFGIVGPNGAGKTTTLEMIEGLRKRDKGRIEILGMDPEKNKYDIRERIGIQFQSTSIQERIKVKEAIQLFSSFYKKKGNVDQIIRTLGIDQVFDSYFKDLSGGWRQRVTLALTAIHDPEIIFLDEPSTGLDPQARRELWGMIKMLRSLGKTIVVTTHYMEEAEKLCDRVAMFQKGKVIAVDQPNKLVKEFISTSFLSFTSEQVHPALLHHLPGVERVESEGVRFKVYSSDLQEMTLTLFQKAKEEQWQIEDFKFETGSLDDLFVHLAKGDKLA